MIRASSTLPQVTGLLYQLNGRVDVGCDGGFTAPTAGAPFTTSTVACPAPSRMTADTNVTLTIEPGVIVYGGTGQSWLAVNRGNRINAVGTATQPIIFTSRDNVLGLNTDTSQGQWGGVVLMGRARDHRLHAPARVAGNTCERQTEGAPDPARFGGADDTYNAGRLSYVQIRFSGFILGANVELQSLTTEGVGSGTTLDHIQSFNSSDDGAEFFGGQFEHEVLHRHRRRRRQPRRRHRRAGRVQYALLLQRPGLGDALMEIDSNGNEADTPRTKLRVANFTAIQPSTSSNNEANDQAATLFRGNSDTTLVNGVIVAPNNECIRMNGSGGASSATLTARSVVLQCNATKYIGTGSYTAARGRDGVRLGRQQQQRRLHQHADQPVRQRRQRDRRWWRPTRRTLSAFFDSRPTYIGAVRNAADTWYAAGPATARTRTSAPATPATAPRCRSTRKPTKGARPARARSLRRFRARLEDFRIVS